MFEPFFVLIQLLYMSYANEEDISNYVYTYEYFFILCSHLWHFFYWLLLIIKFSQKYWKLQKKLFVGLRAKTLLQEMEKGPFAGHTLHVKVKDDIRRNLYKGFGPFFFAMIYDTTVFWQLQHHYLLMLASQRIDAFHTKARATML